MARMATESGLFPVFEAEYGEVISSKKIRRQVAVVDYLKPQKRFAHLFGAKGRPDLLELIQSNADRNIKKYQLMDENSVGLIGENRE